MPGYGLLPRNRAEGPPTIQTISDPTFPDRACVTLVLYRKTVW